MQVKYQFLLEGKSGLYLNFSRNFNFRAKPGNDYGKKYTSRANFTMFIIYGEGILFVVQFPAGSLI